MAIGKTMKATVTETSAASGVNRRSTGMPRGFVEPPKLPCATHFLPLIRL